MALYSVTLVVAACSMIYELLLAQCMTILYGHTIARYSLTIGLFLFSLGMGTLLYPKAIKRGTKERLFINVELALCGCGAFAPVLIFLAAGIKLGDFDLGYYLAHFWVLLIGVLTGLEVPCLLDRGEALAQTNRNTFTILALDFFGTFLGVGLFTLWLYPSLGIVAAAAIAGLANALAALTLWRSSERRSKLQLINFCLLFLFGLLALSSHRELSEMMIGRAFG